MKSKEIVIKKGLVSDLKNIARLHIKNIKSGFLSQLGERFLIEIYNLIISDSKSFCFIAKKNGQIIGFISATENSSFLYKKFFRKNIFLLLVIITKMIFNWKIFKKVTDHLFYPGKRNGLPPAELLSIVVDQNHRRNSVGLKLFIMMKKEFKKRKIKNFTTTVGLKIIQSNLFMEKMGGKKIIEIKVHNKEKSNVYLWQ